MKVLVLALSLAGCMRGADSDVSPAVYRARAREEEPEVIRPPLRNAEQPTFVLNPPSALPGSPPGRADDEIEDDVPPPAPPPDPGAPTSESFPTAACDPLVLDVFMHHAFAQPHHVALFVDHATYDYPMHDFEAGHMEIPVGREVIDEIASAVRRMHLECCDEVISIEPTHTDPSAIQIVGQCGQARFDTTSVYCFPRAHRRVFELLRTRLTPDLDDDTRMPSAAEIARYSEGHCSCACR